MDDDRIVLFEGAEGDPETGEGWMPSVWLEHEGEGCHEMYVGVGEEIGGTTEGVSAEAFEAIRARQLNDDERRVMLAAVMGDHMDPDALQSATGKLTAAVEGA
jgi:hypothetical protein